MDCRKFIPVAMVVVIFSGCNNQCGKLPSRRASGFQITHSYAGLLIQEPSGRYSYEDLHVIPMRENQAFGWWMRVESNSIQMRWREELEFPSPPPASVLSAEPGQLRLLSSDGRTIITENTFYPRNHWLQHIWTMHKNYPRGKYVFRVYLDDIPAGVFPFETE